MLYLLAMLSPLCTAALAGEAPPPPLGDLPTFEGKTTFYLDLADGEGTDLRVLHDGQVLDVEPLGRCVLPGDSEPHRCFRALSGRTGLLSLRIDVLEDGQWKPGEEVLVGMDGQGTVVAHLPQWIVYTYGGSGGGWAVGLNGEWSVCRTGEAMPTAMDCFRDSHWAYPSNELVQVEVQHPDGPLRRGVIPLARGQYTFRLHDTTIWGSLSPIP